MKQIYYFFFALLLHTPLCAATYRNYIAHSITGNTYIVWVNSDTVPGEDVIGQICFTPLGGGPTAFTGFQVGSFNTSQSGANWRVEITVPTGATNLLLELANENQSNMPYGYTGCNVSLSNVLAVELLSFSATPINQGIELKWTTALEKDNAYFILERANKQAEFAPIAQIQGSGTTAEGITYRFVDTSPAAGFNYYRLKDVDFNRVANYSKVISVLNNIKHSLLSLGPNPFTEEVWLRYEAQKQEVLPLEIFNTNGQQVLKLQQWLKKGLNELKIDLSNFQPGVYYFRFKEEVGTLVKL